MPHFGYHSPQREEAVAVNTGNGCMKLLPVPKDSCTCFGTDAGPVLDYRDLADMLCMRVCLFLSRGILEGQFSICSHRKETFS